jgi:hypothetical protein
MNAIALASITDEANAIAKVLYPVAVLVAGIFQLIVPRPASGYEHLIPLVTWQGEFGRMPISQRGVGRDHNPGAQTVLMAGAGITGGQVIGSTDEFGYKAMEQPISYHDLHATMLHLLGLDHTKLTYRFNGRDMRLTDVYGTLIPQIVKT